MISIGVEQLNQTPTDEQIFEIVERKGLGHPDSICDAIADHASQALCKEYQNKFGRILHYNLDKIMLVAGEASPSIGNGKVIKPMRLIFGDRATTSDQGLTIDVESIVIHATKDWIRNHLRFVDPDIHLIYQNEIKKGSPELTDLFERTDIGANDTSAAVGFAPFTVTEELVLALEKQINSSEFKSNFPQTGEDVKVMAIREGRTLNLTIAIAFVGSLVLSVENYFQIKEQITKELLVFLEQWKKHFDQMNVEINTLDDPSRGENGIYLTVLGISADGADSGQVGRGNRANGLITLNRPQSIEAHAGKNPVNHIGKIYSHLANQMAFQIYSQVEGVREVYVYLCSQIGKPIHQPKISAAKLILKHGVKLAQVQNQVEMILKDELAKLIATPTH